MCLYRISGITLRVLFISLVFVFPSHSNAFAGNSYSLDLEVDSVQYAFISDGQQTGLDITEDLTIEAWVKPESQPGSTNGNFFAIASKSNADVDEGGYTLEYRTGPDRFDFIISTDGENGSHCIQNYSLATTSWSHVAATLDASEGKCEIYVNGVIIGSSTGQSSVIHDTSAPFRIGRDNYTTSYDNYFDGLVDEVRVWSEARSPIEIIENYNKVLVGDEQNLEGYWRLENNYLDETSNNNHLTPVNSPVFVSDVPVVSDSEVVGPNFLTQNRVDGKTDLPEGDSFVGNGVVFSGNVGVDEGGLERGLEVEVKLMEEDFDETDTHTSKLSTNATATVRVTDFLQGGALYQGENSGDFKWRARTVDEEGNTSDWVEFGNDEIDFSIVAVPLVTQIASPYPNEIATAGWASSPYADGGAEYCGSTIAGCGCALASLSTLAYHHGISIGIDGSDVNPENLNDWLLKNNGFDPANNPIWLAALEYFAVEENGKVLTYFDWIESTGSNEATNELLQETPVIAYTANTPGDYTHFYILDSQLDTGYEVSDPHWYNTQTSDDTYSPADKTQDYNNDFDSARLIQVNTEGLPVGAALEIHHRGGEVLVTDAEGKRAGEDFTSNQVFDEIEGGEFTEETSIYSGDESPSEPAETWNVIRIINSGSPYFIISLSGEVASEYFLSIFHRDAEGESVLDSYEGVFPTTGELILTAGDVSTEGKLLTLISWMQSYLPTISGKLGDVLSERIESLKALIFSGNVSLPPGQEKRLEKWFEAYLENDLNPRTYVGLVTSILGQNR